MSWLDDLTLDTVVVHTKTGTSIKGLKRAVYSDGIVLKDASILEEEGIVTLDGDQFVPRENVNFMQLIPNEAS